MNDIRLCIAYPNKSGYSETFIKAHLDNLNPSLRLYGGWYPSIINEDASIFKFPSSVFFIAGIIKRFFPAYFRKLYTGSLSNILKEEKIDIVFCEYGPTGMNISDACKKSNIPLIVQFLGFDAFEADSLKQYNNYKKLIDSSRKVIAVSVLMQKALIQLGFPEDKVFYIPCGADISKFSGTDPGKNPPTFIAVGRFVEKKAPQLTIKAFKLVLEKSKESRLVMIGDGPLLGDCKNLADELGLLNSVTFLGYQKPEFVLGEMAAARAFVQHSVTAKNGDMEGTPVGILEASAMCLPIVSTIHGGIMEAVIDNETGFLVEEYNYIRMAEKMTLLALDSEMAKKMGLNARKHIAENYSMKMSINNIKKVIQASI